jgi:hypothetical protein
LSNIHRHAPKISCSCHVNLATVPEKRRIISFSPSWWQSIIKYKV